MTTPTLTSFAASRQSRLAFVPSKPTQVGLEPRHSPPLKGGSASGPAKPDPRLPLGELVVPPRCLV